MTLSIIIVNYNVKYFLEQCLFSVQKACAGIDAEVMVLDNCSTDGSVDYLQQKFPAVHFINNQKNIGFAKANNIGMSLAKGAYILLLNPDTIIPEGYFAKCISFFEHHADCGALGARMIDGNGIFLPESKRSFPSPATSFYKLSGLSVLFTKSKIFNRYALGYLNDTGDYAVDVLCGAFMMLTKEVVVRTKGLDESFFMYGEDVDLSYRIQQLGFKNYYFGSGGGIIHFKGESANKGSSRHTKMFYEAMVIFVNKHYGKGKAGMFTFLLKIGIWMRAVITSLMYSLNNLFSLTKKQIEENKFLLVGNDDEIIEAKKILLKHYQDATIETSMPNEKALSQILHTTTFKNIILCEGRLSYQNIISAIETNTRKVYWFHAKRSSSIVSSQLKSKSGIAIGL